MHSCHGRRPHRLSWQLIAAALAVTVESVASVGRVVLERYICLAGVDDLRYFFVILVLLALTSSCPLSSYFDALIFKFKSGSIFILFCRGI